jgi:hypothetical protein
VNLVDILRDLVRVLAEPFEVEAVGEELAGRRRHQRSRPLDGGDLVEQPAHGRHPVWMEAILVVADVEDEDVSVARESWHWLAIPFSA